MNKTTINLLCIIFLAVLTASIIVPGIGMVSSFFAGFEDGAKSREADNTEVLKSTPVEVTVNITDNFPEALQDTIQADNGVLIPIQITKGMVNVPGKNYSAATLSIVILCALAGIAIFILLFIQVVKFVVRINRGEIFNKRNISILNKTGIYLLILGFLQSCIGIAEDFAVSGMGLSFSGLALTSNWNIPWSELLLGIMALLMAQVWARGVHLKEEQELTI